MLFLRKFFEICHFFSKKILILQGKVPKFSPKIGWGGDNSAFLARGESVVNKGWPGGGNSALGVWGGDPPSHTSHTYGTQH